MELFLNFHTFQHDTFQIILSNCNFKNQIKQIQVKIRKMQNVPYPFNKKEHTFDFKVKVNFENGNISLTAPQIVSPPALFDSHTVSNQNYGPLNPFNQNRPVNYPQNRVNPGFNAIYSRGMPPVNNHPYQHTNQMITYPYQQANYKKVQNIELVNSSYTSFRESQFPINCSMQIIECVLCQKSFNASQFDDHLQLHKNRANRNINNQKANSSNYMLTQNSFNSNNQSSISSNGRGNQPFQNESYQSIKSRGGIKSVQSGSNRQIKQTTVQDPNLYNASDRQLNNAQVSQASLGSKQGKIHLSQPNKSITPNKTSLNQSLHSLGRIENPILAMNAAQQASMSHSYSSHPNNSLSHPNNSLSRPNNSLNYSNSSGHQLTMGFKDPNQINSLGMINQNSPQFNQINHSDSSSFGNHLGLNVIGPSFFQNNSHQSAMNRNEPLIKGINRLAYEQINNSHYSNHLNGHLAPNSFSGSNSSYNSHNSMNNIGQNTPVQPNSNMMAHNFKQIQSRYVNQPNGQINSNHLYGSHQQINHIPSQRNPLSQQVVFHDDDISSISRTSRITMSQNSEWSDLHQNQEIIIQGYNSAENSLMRNAKHKMQKQEPNVYLNRSQNNQNNQQGFLKKKKDFMINSATSYYDRNFKDQQYSSSDDEQQMHKTGRLSYVQRLKQKRMTDGRPQDNLKCESVKNSKSLKHSDHLKASKYSDSSNLSKTKLPLNYLAREQFISTSTNSKSTHKSTNVN